MTVPLIQVENLSVTYGGGLVPAVSKVNLSLGTEKLGIVGESGSGKSTVGRAIMRLLPPSATATADRMHFGGTNLLTASEKVMTGLRGRHMALIMQDPKYSLNPVMRVGEQISETFLQHNRDSHSPGQATEKMLAMLEAVQIRDPIRVARLYPHEVSGGMGQRIMIAMMLIADPEVLIADEATSALDVSVRLEVLALLDDLIEHRNLSLIFISHDLNLMRNFCDRVLIMYAGNVIETLNAADLGRAKHPYTQALLASLPSINRQQTRLPTMTRDPAWAQDTGGGGID